MSSVLSRRYVQSLFEVARAKGEVDRIKEDLRRMNEALESSAQLCTFILDPSVKRASKRGALEQMFADSSPFTLNFYRVVIDKNRGEILSHAYSVFCDLHDASLGITKGTIESATLLAPDLLQQVQAALEKKFDCKLELKQEIVPDLIGGFRARVGNTLMDGSVRGRLAKLQETLTGQ